MTTKGFVDFVHDDGGQSSIEYTTVALILLAAGVIIYRNIGAELKAALENLARKWVCPLVDGTFVDDEVRRLCQPVP
jgi:Flp pilus assembly pilin Flp